MNKFNQNIDLNLYKTFYVVAENKSFSKAAEKIFVSQPAISYNIKELEKYLDVKLFYRNAKGVTLTQDGENLYYYIKTAYDYIFLGEQSIKDSREMKYGNIRIGIPTHIGLFYLSNKIEHFHNKYPRIKFYIQNRSTADMVYMLERHELDFIIDSYPIDNLNIKLNTRKLASLETVFVGNTSLVEKCEENFLDDKNLSKIPLILPNSNTATRKKLNEVLENYEIQIDPMMEISTTELTLDMIRRGIGIGWLIKETVTKELKEGILKQLKLNIKLPNIDVGIAYIDKYVTYITKKFIEEEIK